MSTTKVTFKLVRSFTVGFTIYSPKLNGFCVDFSLGPFTLNFWSRGKQLFKFKNYWNSYT